MSLNKKKNRKHGFKAIRRFISFGIDLSSAKNSQSGRSRDWRKGPRGVSCFMFVTQAAVKGKQKGLSREQQDRSDKAHTPKFNSTSGPVKCSHRSDEKQRLNTTGKWGEKITPKKTNGTSAEY